MVKIESFTHSSSICPGISRGLKKVGHAVLEFWGIKTWIIASYQIFLDGGGFFFQNETKFRFPTVTVP